MEERNQINYFFIGLSIGFGFLALFLFLQNWALVNVLDNNVNVAIENQEFIVENQMILNDNIEVILKNQNTIYNAIDYLYSSEEYESTYLPENYYNYEDLICELPKEELG